MALNAWQLLTRVLPGQPFGTGADGALTISASATQTLTDETCTGTADATALTAGGTSLADGDIVMIHQTSGTGAGQWEINKVASGGGSVNLVMSVALKYSYAAGAQVIKIPMYTDVTVNSSQTWSAKAWDGSIGGFLIFAAKGTVTISGTLSGNSLGFRGNVGRSGAGDFWTGYRGEGIAGDNSSVSKYRNENAGGGASIGGYNGTGAGSGAYATSVASSNDAQSGDTVGDTNLQTLFFGGAGGSSAAHDDGGGNRYNGGNGGAIVHIMANRISTITSILCTGGSVSGNSGKDDMGQASGGAGGSILICAGMVDIGTDKLSVVGGNGYPGYTAYKTGVAGGKGRIAVYYGLSLTGTISSSLYGTYTNAQDTGLVEASSSFFLMF